MNVPEEPDKEKLKKCPVYLQLKFLYTLLPHETHCALTTQASSSGTLAAHPSYHKVSLTRDSFKAQVKTSRAFPTLKCHNTHGLLYLFKCQHFHTAQWKESRKHTKEASAWKLLQSECKLNFCVREMYPGLFCIKMRGRPWAEGSPSCFFWRVINCLYFHLKCFVKSVITFSMIEGFIYALVKDWHRSGFTVSLMPHSRSGSKSWLPFQKRFKFCAAATLPGRGSSRSPRSWCESCSPQGWAQDPGSQTEDTLLSVSKQIRYSHVNCLNFK